MEAFCAGSAVSLAVIVYTPAVRGAVSTTALPLELVVGLKVPPAGLMLQLTPLESLVFAVTCSCWPIVRPAAAGEIVIETWLGGGGDDGGGVTGGGSVPAGGLVPAGTDPKSTRLNSSP